MRTPTALVLVALLFAALPARGEDERSPTVGMPARIEQIVLPGPELEAKPLEDERTPIVLRVTGVYRHGDAHRYDLVYYGLEPGTFDLTDYLRRKDGSPAEDLPPVLVEIQSVLPPGQVRPNELEMNRSPWLGGYRLLLKVAVVVWVIGLLAILFHGRFRRSAASAAPARPRTLAERLRPLVERAMGGSLSPAGRAELERLLLAFWRKRLNLEGLPPAEAMAKLRENPEASPLLDRLDEWLHKPGAGEKVDVAELLRPYRDDLVSGSLREW